MCVPTLPLALLAITVALAGVLYVAMSSLLAGGGPAGRFELPPPTWETAVILTSVVVLGGIALAQRAERHRGG